MKNEFTEITNTDWRDNVSEDVLVDRGLMVVKSVLKRILSKSRNLSPIRDELYSAGIDGLMSAAQSYNKGHGSKASFQTYAYYIVRGAMYACISDETKYHRTRYLEEVKPVGYDKNFNLEGDLRINLSASSHDAVIPDSLDRYERLVMKWAGPDGLKHQTIRRRLKNLRSTRSLEEIKASIREKIFDANEKEKSII